MTIGIHRAYLHKGHREDDRQSFPLCFTKRLAISLMEVCGYCECKMNSPEWKCFYRELK